MLTEPLIQQLQQLHLKGMAHALEQQMTGTDSTARSFEDRLGLLIQHEITDRATTAWRSVCAGPSCRRTPVSRTSTPARRAVSIRQSLPNSPISPGSSST